MKNNTRLEDNRWRIRHDKRKRAFIYQCQAVNRPEWSRYLRGKNRRCIWQQDCPRNCRFRLLPVRVQGQRGKAAGSPAGRSRDCARRFQSLWKHRQPAGNREAYPGNLRRELVWRNFPAYAVGTALHWNLWPGRQEEWKLLPGNHQPETIRQGSITPEKKFPFCSFRQGVYIHINFEVRWM